MSHSAVPDARRRRGRLSIATAVVCLAACSGHLGRAAPEQPPLVLKLGAALPPPGVSGIGIPAVVRGLFSEGALGLDRSGRVQPRVFQSWEWLEGGTVLRLTLPRGIRFHDGSVLTPETAAGILRRQFARSDVFTFEAVTDVRAHQDFVDIRLSRPEPFLPDDLVEVSVTTGAGGTIGTGPFMLENGNPPTNDGGRLLAFAGYRLGRPRTEAIEVRGYPSLRAAWSAMMRGEINALHEVSSDAAHFVEAESSVRTYPFVRPYTYFVAFNMRHPVLGRREVRQALSHAIDRSAIIRDAMKGRGEVADGPVWKYHWAYSTAQPTYRYNPEAASLRLDAAGLRRTAAHAPGRMPGRFRFTCLMFGDDPRFERIALVLQKQLFDIGVDMVVEPVSLGELVSRMRRGDYDAFLLEMISGRSISWTYRVWHSHPDAAPGEFNSGFTTADAALDRLRRASIDAEVRSAVSEFQRLIYDDPPALFLAWPTTSRAVSAEVYVPYERNVDVLGRVARFERAPEGPVDR